MWEGERKRETVIGFCLNRAWPALFFSICLFYVFFMFLVFFIFLCLRFGNERTYEEATADQDHFEMFALLLVLYFVIFLSTKEEEE